MSVNAVYQESLHLQEGKLLWMITDSNSYFSVGEKRDKGEVLQHRFYNYSLPCFQHMALMYKATKEEHFGCNFFEITIGKKKVY